jgi:hypothetical protein
MAKRRVDSTEEREGRYAAFLSRLDPPPSEEDGIQWGDHTFEPNKRRAEFLFESIKLEAIEVPSDATVEPFARPLLRLLTTPARFAQVVGRAPTPGEWFLISLAGRPNGPLVWTAVEDPTDPTGSRAEGAFSLETAQFLDPLQDLTPSGGGALLSLGAKTSIAKYELLPSSLRRLRRLQPTTTVLNQASSLFVDAIDVGQASFVSIHDKRNSFVFFDVGRPLWFHNKSLPRAVHYYPPHKDAAVVLSHWDYDHYSGVYRDAKLKGLPWIAPADKLGPTSYALAKSLGTNLITLAHGKQLNLGPLKLVWAKGPLGDRNNRGIVGVVRTKGKKILLTGDASYGFISSSAKTKLTGVQVPHHGSAHSAGPVPKPKSPATAVICVGVPNRYRHPSKKIIGAHSQWSVSATGTTSLGTRGNKSL